MRIGVTLTNNNDTCVAEFVILMRGGLSNARVIERVGNLVRDLAGELTRDRPAELHYVAKAGHGKGA